MGPGQKFLLLRLGWVELGWVSHFGLGLGLESFPKKSQIFQSASHRNKKISSGRVKKCPGQRRVRLLFTGGQKYAQVESGSIST